MEPNSSDAFCFQQNSIGHLDAQVVLYYEVQIHDGKGGWKDSGFYMDGSAKVPLFFFQSNELHCSIKQDGSTKEINWAPFLCNSSWGNGPGGNDPQPRWSVASKPKEEIDAVADPVKARDEVNAHCTLQDTPQCVWHRASISAFVLPRGNWKQLTNVHSSCRRKISRRGLRGFRASSSRGPTISA